MADQQLPGFVTTTIKESKMNTNIYILKVLPYQGFLVQTFEVIRLFR